MSIANDIINQRSLSDTGNAPDDENRAHASTHGREYVVKHLSLDAPTDKTDSVRSHRTIFADRSAVRNNPNHQTVH